MKIRTYSELIRLPTFLERFHYLELRGEVGVSTFGYDRYLNQAFYHSTRWRRFRRDMIIRDNGCDLGVEGYEINGLPIVLHHLNVISVEDLENDNSWIYNPEFVICTTDRTHKAIHYSNESMLPSPFEERKRYDTVPWRK